MLARRTVQDYMLTKKPKVFEPVVRIQAAKTAKMEWYRQGALRKRANVRRYSYNHIVR
jgi:hypothetical protein